jgi:hypothetical protein
MVGFFVYLTICLLSLLDLGIRHFLIPVTILILMLAPLPRLLGSLSGRRLWQTAVTVAALSSFATIAIAYPYFLPFVNSLSFGHPVFQLMNDSNVSWNDGLLEVRSFAEQHRMSRIELDWAAITDPTPVVPQARDWDCQEPSESDQGQWVAIAAVSLLENHNCGYLLQYPHQPLAGGSFYVFQLPLLLPQPGRPGGPPLPAERKLLWGLPFDMRGFMVQIERHPERLQSDIQELMKKMMQMGKTMPGSGKS